MKKAWLGLLVTPALLYPVMSGLMGYGIESRVAASLSEMQANAPYVKIVENTFHRGWFSSEQALTVEAFQGSAGMPGLPNSLSPMGTPFRVRVRNEFRHGPICGFSCVGLAGVTSHIEFSGPLQELLTTVFGAAEPFQVRARLGFFGGGSAVIDSPPVKDVALPDGAHLNWDGISLSSDFSANSDSYSVHAAAPRTRYAGADGKRLEVDGVTLDVHSRRALRTLYVGDSSVVVEHILFDGVAGSGSFAVNELRSASTSTASAGFMSMALKLGTDAVTTAPLSLTGTHVDITLGHLDMDALERLTTEARKQQQGTPADFAALKQVALQLLSHDPEFDLDRISFATAAGAARLTGTVRLQGVGAADFAEGADPKALVQKLGADLDLTIDVAMVKSLPGGATLEAQLKVLTDQGLATLEGGGYHTKIAFHQGNATFNGKPFAPGGLIAPGAATPTPPAH